MDENEDAEHLLLPPRRRFRPVLIIGVITLIALDNEAHRSWPFLLQASSYEQGIAQQIVAQAQ